jgi:hypothetical protein
METFHGVFSHERQRVEPIHPTNKSLNIRNLIIDIQKQTCNLCQTQSSSTNKSLNIQNLVLDIQKTNL